MSVDIDDFSDIDAGDGPGTAGNDADIEDNLLPPIIDWYTVMEKLRSTSNCPQECFQRPNSVPCNIRSSARRGSGDNSVSENNKGQPSAIERLSARPKSALEAMTETIEKPEGAVPPLALPHWHCLPLDKKIPRLPAPPGFMYYSAGKICTKLDRKHKFYNLEDPYNRERTAGHPYTILFDPHGKSFVTRPITKRLLNQQGLINKNNEVILSLWQFNKYRDYLRTLFLDDVHQSLRNVDDLFKKDREQLRIIRQSLNDEEGKCATRKRKFTASRRGSLSAEEFRLSRITRRREQLNARLELFEKERNTMYVTNMLRGARKNNVQLEKKRALEEARKLEQVRMLQQSALKELKSMERKRDDGESLKKAHENYLLEWMNTKINQSKMRLEQETMVARNWKETQRIKSEQRQKRMEMLRKNIPNAIERKRQLEARKWEIVRKYFYIWLNKTRQRLTAPDLDKLHESCWIRGATGTLDETVQYLRFQTDTHAKLDNFILSILRLKAAIKKQLELEGSDSDEAEKPDSPPASNIPITTLHTNKNNMEE